MLCPKGVKRYLQGSHPDRLLHALVRDSSAASGFRTLGYEEAVSRTASEIGRERRSGKQEVLRHRSGFPLRYDPLYWGAVFPLGMYTAATARLATAVEAPYLLTIPRWTVFVALAGWALTFAGMAAQGLRAAVRRPALRS
jgi:hypothetical protein